MPNLAIAPNAPRMSIWKNTPLNLGIYALAMAGTIVGESKDMHTLVFICKPLMLVVLSSWFFFNSRRVGDRFTLLIQAGLFFSLIGDVALMFQHVDQFNFLIGLGAFMLAQLCYAMAFMHNIVEVGMARGLLVSILLSVLIMAYGYFFASGLMPFVDEGIELPVIIYAIAISFMGVSAAWRFGRTFLRSFLMVMIGAAFFIASDSLLATNRFHRPLDHATWSVMLTYAIAQVLIAAGALVHVLDPDEIRRKAALST